jgi:hypothetical protein
MDTENYDWDGFGCRVIEAASRAIDTVTEDFYDTGRVPELKEQVGRAIAEAAGLEFKPDKPEPIPVEALIKGGWQRIKKALTSADIDVLNGPLDDDSRRFLGFKVGGGGLLWLVADLSVDPKASEDYAETVRLARIDWGIE